MCFACSALRAQETRHITGRVLATPDSTPLGSVLVAATGSRSTLTDSAGRFELDAPNTAVRLLIRRIGIVPDSVMVPAGRDTVTILARALAVQLAPVGVEAEISPARARFDTLALPSIMTLSPRDIVRAPGLLEPDVLRAVQLLPGTVALN